MPRARERERKTQTDRERFRRACLRHLKDLGRAHAAPPADIAVKVSAVVGRVSATPATSSCTSPGALCAELMS